MAVFEVFVNQMFPMLQGEPETNPQGAFVNQILSLGQSVSTNQKSGTGISRFQMSHTAAVDHTLINITISQFLYMWQTGGRGPHVFATHFYHLWHTAVVSAYETPSNILYLSQSVLTYFGHDGKNTLVINQTLTYKMVRNLLVSQTYAPVSDGTSFLPNPNFINEIEPSLSGPNGPPEYVW